jgi:hypothetical protein
LELTFMDTLLENLVLLAVMLLKSVKSLQLDLVLLVIPTQEDKQLSTLTSNSLTDYENYY